MPIKKQRGYPTYVQKYQDAERKKRERQQHEDNVKIICALNRVADQLMTDEKEEERRDYKKASREYLTIFLVFSTVIAAGIGDVFFYGQMTEMKRTYGPIESQANAATKSAEALMAAERPHLLPQTITVKGAKGTPDDNGLVQLTIDYTFINFGRSPLFMGNASLSSSYALPEQPEYAFPINNRFILPVGGTYHTIGDVPLRKITKAEADKIAKGETIIYIFGYIEYTDIFRNPHKTCFAYKVVFENEDVSKNFFPFGPPAYWCYS